MVSAVRVTTAAQAAERDAAAIASGVASFDLMVQAGTQAAAYVLREYADRLADGVAVYCGTGNNGGDAYIVAAQLGRVGVAVRVMAVAAPRSPDAGRAFTVAQEYGVSRSGQPTGREQVVIDGLLGTGAHGPLRQDVAAVSAQIARAAAGGAHVVALDVPSGLDATTGVAAEGSVPAHSTVCFGTIKRGLLLNRTHAGRVVLVDIGLAHHADLDDQAWQFHHADSLHALMVPLAWDAHKGVRGRVAVVGGHEGMAGAAVLAVRGALGAGAGVVHANVDGASVAVLQAAVPQALAAPWAQLTEERQAPEARHAVAIGPGLGRSERSWRVLQQAVATYRDVPLVLDADALWLLASKAREDAVQPSALLRAWSSARRGILCTPHVGEFAMLLGHDVPKDWHARAEALHDFAQRSGATVLLKGTPTLVASPDERPLAVVPHGTGMLATGGSGDLLTGIALALMGQGAPPRSAAVVAASAHGMAAEWATRSAGGVRGTTLDAVVAALPSVWHDIAHARGWPTGVLLTLPNVSEWAT